MEDLQRNPKDQEQNPLGGEINVEISIPQKFEIRMVDATVLGDYELWTFIASIICNFFVGFMVATFNAEKEFLRLYILFDIFCGILMVISLVMAISKRKKLSIEKKTLTLGLKKDE